MVAVSLKKFFFKQKTAYEMSLCDWSSDVCSSDLDSSTTARGGRQISSIVAQEAASYFSGQKSATDVATLIQNRVSIYLEEQN